MAFPTNTRAKELSKTIEARMISAIKNDNQKIIEDLMGEAEYLLNERYLTPNEFNTITDIELMKEICL